jgi:serine/threonine protein kinase
MNDEPISKGSRIPEVPGIGVMKEAAQAKRIRKVRSGARPREKVVVNDRYQILEDIGIGGQGELYLARDIQDVEGGVRLREKVIVNKLFCRCSTGDAWAKFDDRAKAIRNLDHGNIVPYIDHFLWPVGDYNWPALVTRQPKGQSLHTILKDALCLPWKDVCQVMLQCLEALIYARDRGISPHLNINPSNIFVTTDGATKIRDFDTTRCVEDVSGATPAVDAAVLDYMAAEVYRNDGLDERSDIYSLGLCAFECLTGRRPRDVAKELGKTWGDTPEVTDLVFDLPVFWILSPEVRAIINKAVQIDKARRFETFEKMRDALKKVPGELPGDGYRVVKGVNGEYRLIAFVAEGGFGSVFKAERVSDGSLVCVKRLLRPRHKEESLRREADTLKACRHDHIVTYVDFTEPAEDGYQYLVMEFLEGMPGDSLRKRIDNSKPNGMDRREVLALFGHFAEALSYLHMPVPGQRKAIMHGDIKPANLYAPEKRPEVCKILDFGIACDMETATGVGGVQGTPDYRAPELGKGSSGTPRTDVFSLGVCFYEALTGNLPSPSHDNYFGDCPALREVVDKATARDPRQRYQTANELRRGIRNVQRTLEDIEEREREVAEEKEREANEKREREVGETKEQKVVETKEQKATGKQKRRHRIFLFATVVAILAGTSALLLTAWFLYGKYVGENGDEVAEKPEVIWPSTPPYDSEARATQERIREYEKMGETVLADDLRKSLPK